MTPPPPFHGEESIESGDQKSAQYRAVVLNLSVIVSLLPPTYSGDVLIPNS